MRHLLLSAVCVAATDSNATFGALADRVEWTRVNNKASYDWPNSTLRHFAPAEAMDLLRGRHVLVLGNSVARHVSSVWKSNFSRLTSTNNLTVQVTA